MKAVYRDAHRPLKHPVIVLIDNDSGSDPVFGAMRQHNVTVSQTTALPFYHVCFNLYVVKTPEAGTNGASCIEDLFDAAILAETLAGKTLSRADKFDTTSITESSTLLTRSFRPRFATIDFSRFAPLLNRLVAVLHDYSAKKP